MRCCACVASNHMPPILRVVQAGEKILPGWLPHDNANLFCMECQVFWDTHLHVTRLPTFESTFYGPDSPLSPYVAITFSAVEGLPDPRERFGPPLTSRPPPPWSQQPWPEAPPAEHESHTAAHPPGDGNDAAATATDAGLQAYADAYASSVRSGAAPHALPPDLALRFAVMVMVGSLNEAAARFAARFAADPSESAAAAVAAAAAVQEEQRSMFPGDACDACGQRTKRVMNYPCMHVVMCTPCSLLNYPRVQGQREVPDDPDAACTKCNETVSHLVRVTADLPPAR